MKRLNVQIRCLTLLLFMVFAMGALADNTVSVTSVSAHPGEEVGVTVSLRNTDGVAAAELNFQLDGNLSYVAGSAKLAEERAQGYSVSSSVKDGVLKLIVYSLQDGVLKPGEGALLSFKLRLGRMPGVYALSPEVILSSSEGKRLSVSMSKGGVTVLSPWINVAKETIDMGRIAIRSSHKTLLTLKNEGTEELLVSSVKTSSAELVCDTSVFTIQPGGSKEISLMLLTQNRGMKEYDVEINSNAGNGNQCVKVIAESYSVNELKVSNASGKMGDEVTINLDMENMEDIVAMQASFSLPDEVEYVKGSLSLGKRAEQLSCSESYADGRLSLFIYSMSGNHCGGDSGTLCSFKLKLNGASGNYRLNPVEVILGNADMENMLSAVYPGILNIKSASIHSAGSVDVGSVDCTKTAEITYEVRNDGESDLVIDKVMFTESGFTIEDLFPVVIASGNSKTLTILCASDEREFSSLMQLYTNDPDMRIKNVELHGTSYEPNVVSMEAKNNGDVTNLNVALDNYSTIVAAQMDIHLPNGLNLETNDVKTTERLMSHSFRMADIGDGVFRVMIYSMEELPVGGNSGELFFLKLKQTTGVNSDIVIDNILLSTADGDNCASITKAVCHIASEEIVGDANNDGNVDEADITAVLDYMAGKKLASFNEKLADANGDGKIDVADCTRILDLIKQ